MNNIIGGMSDQVCMNADMGGKAPISISGHLVIDVTWLFGRQ